MIFLKKYWLHLISILILFFFFKVNSENELPYDYISESLIVGRILESEKSGIFSYSGLPGMITDSSNTEDFKKNAINQFHLLVNSNEAEKFKIYKTYNSQTGGQGIIYATFNKISPFSLTTNITILKNITLIINALMFSIFIGWCRRNFGAIPAIIVLLFLSISSWIWLFSDSLWWCLWAFFLPFLTMTLSLEFLKNQTNKILFLVFISVFLKCFFNGFEFISTTLLAIYTPIVFYFIKNRRKWMGFIFFSIKTGGVILLGVILEMMLLIYQLKELLGSYTLGINHILYSYTTRTADVIIEGKTASLSNNMHVQIILKYLSGDVFSWLNISAPFVLIIALIGISNLILLKINLKKYKPIVITTWFSFLAPLSWFLIFIQHSKIHTHLNFIIWYLPFLPIGMISIGILIEILIKNCTKSNI